MNAAHLAEILLRTPDASVLAWDADCQMWCEVTGIVGSEHEQKIQTDTD